MKHSIVAVTGFIGSGKSVVGNYLKQKGYCVIDCDQIAKEVSELPSVVMQVERLLGSCAVVDGKINRPYVRQTVFQDEELLAKYNEIFHAQVRTILEQECSRNELTFVEVAPISTFVFPWTAKWFIDTPESKRLERASQRDGVDVENIRAISSRQQMPSDVTCVVQNDGSLDELLQKIDKLLTTI